MMPHNGHSGSSHDKNGKKPGTGPGPGPEHVEMHGAQEGSGEAQAKVESPPASQEVADDLRETIDTMHACARKVLDHAQSHAHEVVAEFKDRLGPVDKWVRTTTSEHPYLIVGSAIGAGFLAGFLVQRRAAVTAGVTMGFLAGCYLTACVPAPSK